jgi:2-polyprenyl-3-methyl-5-hydroxy-6-metoxy-1,4-benzoquinol methylase
MKSEMSRWSKSKLADRKGVKKMSEKFMYDVFLSHSRNDKIVVSKLAERLKVKGLRVWFDEWVIKGGDDIYSTIEQGLEKSRCCIFCMSKAAFCSEWVQLERSTMLFRDPSNQQRRFIPLLLEDCEIPDAIKRLAHIDGRNIDEVTIQKLIMTSVEPNEGINISDSKFYEERYRDWLFNLNGYRIAYIPIINDCKSSKILSLSMTDLEVHRDHLPYKLPEEFTGTKLNFIFRNDPSRSDCCRLSSYEATVSKRLKITLSKTTYEDYLVSSEHLNEPIPTNPLKIFRDAFGEIFEEHKKNLRPFNLTNICGVGVFVISSDNYIIATKHSESSHVYPGRITFTASGTLRWGACPHPFTWTMQKCFEEINHQIDLRRLKMIGFGADARKLYFQFSFIEETEEALTKIIDNCHTNVEFVKIPFELDPIVDYLLNNCWEPTAEATLLTLCKKKYKDELTRYLFEKRAAWNRRDMIEEWDFRASEHGIIPDTSVRYPPTIREQESERYVQWVTKCIEHDIKDADVLEVGCGTGRITKFLVHKARKITCIDLSERMIRKNKLRLGAMEAAKVEYICGFIQDYQGGPHDIVICSLLIIHNVTDLAFRKLIIKICESGNIIFLFEDITQGRPTSPNTRIRREDEIIEVFKMYGFEVVQKDQHNLVDDKILFLKLTRASTIR